MNDESIVPPLAYQFFGRDPHFTFAIDPGETMDGDVDESEFIKVYDNLAQDDLCID